MSFGIPFICSKQVAENFDHMKITKDLYYTNNKEIIKMIIKFKRIKTLVQVFLKNQLIKLKNLNGIKCYLF